MASLVMRGPPPKGPLSKRGFSRDKVHYPELISGGSYVHGAMGRESIGWSSGWTRVCDSAKTSPPRCLMHPGCRISPRLGHPKAIVPGAGGCGGGDGGPITLPLAYGAVCSLLTTIPNHAYLPSHSFGHRALQLTLDR